MIVVIVVGIVGAIAFSLLNVLSLKKEQREVMQQAADLKQEKEQLEKELSQINDPINLEEQARDQLRLIKPGETLYMFPEEITNPSGTDAEEVSEEQDEQSGEQQAE